MRLLQSVLVGLISLGVASDCLSQACVSATGTRGGRGGINIDLSQVKKMDRKDIRINGPVFSEFNVYVAKTPAQLIKGLAGHKFIAPKAGIIFYLDPEDKVVMDTATTQMPVDMLFITPEKRIACVYKNAKPLSKERFTCKEPTLAVVFINAGEAKKYKLREGLTVEGI